MEGVKLGRNSGSTSGCNSSSSMSSQSEEEMMMMMELRRGPWTVEEDLTLINYIANHGEGRWNSLARCAGLKRTGKSCRLRWLNYLRPDVRRGNITLEEQLLILELHSRWGNRWSKIAQHLPGRTDNEIKNYWRTRVQKHAKQLKCDVNSKQFKDTMRYLWMPRLLERIQAANNTTNNNNNDNNNIIIDDHNNNNNNNNNSNIINFGFPNNNVNVVNGVNVHDLENCSTAASSDSFGAQVSPLSDLTDHYNYSTATTTVPVSHDNPNPHQYASFQACARDDQVNGYRPDHHSTLTSAYNSVDNQSFANNQGLVDFQPHQTNWSMDGLDQSDSDMALWNSVDDIWLLQQHFNNGI